MTLVTNLWFFLALGAAMCWGLGYTFADKIIKAGISPYMFLTFLVGAQLIAYPIFFFINHGNLKEQFDILKTPYIAAMIFACIILFIIGNALVFSSIQMKNASLASIIEIGYPFFVVLFSWLIFREVHVNVYTMFGGILVFSGVALIFLKS